MTAANGATYRVVKSGRYDGRYNVEVTHPAHEFRVVVTDYRGNVFQDFEHAADWATYDGELEYLPGKPSYEREHIMAAWEARG